MKHSIAFLLAAAMLFSLCVTAWAEDGNGEEMADYYIESLGMSITIPKSCEVLDEFQTILSGRYQRIEIYTESLPDKCITDLNSLSENTLQVFKSAMIQEMSEEYADEIEGSVYDNGTVKFIEMHGLTNIALYLNSAKYINMYYTVRNKTLIGFRFYGYVTVEDELVMKSIIDSISFD